MATFQSLIQQISPLPAPSGSDVAGALDPVGVVFLLLFAFDELLPFLGGRFKRFNGILQSISELIAMARPLRREDDRIESLKAELEALRQQISKLER
jgi:hypothetical protein